MGRVEIFFGPMFAAKTDALISRVERARYAHIKHQVFKPVEDTRTSTGTIRTHQGRTLSALAITNPKEIVKLLKPDTRLVAIDEAQMFDNSLVHIVTEIASQDITVVIAGLSLDWRGMPWEPVPSLIAIADKTIQLYAVCVVCGADATRSQRKRGDVNRLQIGGSELYEARCRACFDPDLSLMDTTPMQEA